jgi:hypothetical protein
LIRRQLLSWHAIPGRKDALEDWLRTAHASGALGSHFDVAEARFEKLLETLADAPMGSRESQRAFVLFMAGTRRLNEFLGMPRPKDADLWDWIQLLEDAHKDLSECVAALEKGPIQPGLLNEAGILERQRHDEDPLNQLASALLADARQRGLLRPGGHAP